MKLKKHLIIIILTINYLFSQIDITIYNENEAFINEKREMILNEIGKQNIVIENLPKEIDPSSITIFSDNIKFISKEFYNKPITINSILDESIGQEIELVKYGENGEITYSILGKLISNNNIPIFEINNKIVINPPYDYIFNNIPTNLKNSPYLQCKIESMSMYAKFNLLYMINNISWNAEYNLFLNNEKTCHLEGWYSIKNNSNVKFDNANISLVSGKINFDKKPQVPLNTRMTKMATNSISTSNSPNYFRTNDHYVFQLPNNIELPAKAQMNYDFFTKKEIPYKKTYHISHSLQRYRKKSSNKENIPINIRIELKAKDLGNFQIPQGSFKTYEASNTSFTFIGSGTSSIYDNNDIIKLDIGNTRDILCKFSINSHEVGRNHEEAEIQALFTNRKNHDIFITWIENFYDGGWEIFETSDKYERKDAYTAIYNLMIPANSKKEVFFKARIEKK